MSRLASAIVCGLPLSGRPVVVWARGMWASRNASHRLWLTSTRHGMATFWVKSSARVCTICKACHGRGELQPGVPAMLDLDLLPGLSLDPPLR